MEQGRLIPEKKKIKKKIVLKTIIQEKLDIVSLTQYMPGHEKFSPI